MAQDPDLKTPPPDTRSPEAGKPDQQPVADSATTPDILDVGGIDKAYWIACLEDAERAERGWRERGREIIEIYRNEGRTRSGKLKPGKVTFNILFANTEVMLPAVYQKPPVPVVRSRFTKIAEPPPMMPGMPPSSPGFGAPAMPGGIGLGPPLPPGPPQPGPGMMMPPIGPQAAPGRPPQSDIETAASVVQKALEIVLDDEQSDEAVKAAIKDTLLPGRGVARVRWRPQMSEVPVLDEATGAPMFGPDGQPQIEESKVWEEVGDEYVYWEDLLVDPVRCAPDRNWIAFRHLFTKEQLEAEFAGSEEYEMLRQSGRLGDILKWTEESAAKDTIGAGSAIRTAKTLGDQIKKAMVWEIWDRPNRRIIWFIRETAGLTLRIDPDTLELMGFYPIPEPMLAVTTTDTRIPRPYYDLYANLADDLDETWSRISALTRQVKVRGAYNSATHEIAQILTAGDNTMVPVDGVDLISGGLQNHIWLVPIQEFMAALDKLYLAQEQQKQAIYEIMGISDIMRGATKASETATAQRIKGSMGVSRLEDARSSAANFARDLLRLKAEIICQNFDQATLEAMTGERITPAVMEILRSDFMRICAIDIETDSTVQVDEQGEQQAMAQIMQSVQAVMQGAAAMLQTQVLPAPQVIQLSLELLKMFLHPVRYSRPVVQMINDFQMQLTAQITAQAMAPPAPMPPVPPGGADPSQPPEDDALPPGGPPPNGSGAPIEPALGGM